MEGSISAKLSKKSISEVHLNLGPLKNSKKLSCLNFFGLIFKFFSQICINSVQTGLDRHQDLSHQKIQTFPVILSGLDLVGSGRELRSPSGKVSRKPPFILTLLLLVKK